MEQLDFTESYGALESLQKTVQQRAPRAPHRPLPQRPRNSPAEVNPYIDSAIAFLGHSTGTLCELQSSQMSEILKVQEAVETVNRQIKRFEGNVKRDTNSLSGRVNSLSERVEELESKVEDVKSQVEDVK